MSDEQQPAPSQPAEPEGERSEYGFLEGVPETEGDGLHLADPDPKTIEQTPEQFREAVNPSRIPDPDTAD